MQVINCAFVNSLGGVNHAAKLCVVNLSITVSITRNSLDLGKFRYHITGPRSDIVNSFLDNICVLNKGGITVALKNNIRYIMVFMTRTVHNIFHINTSV